MYIMGSPQQAGQWQDRGMPKDKQLDLSRTEVYHNALSSREMTGDSYS